MKTAIIHTRFWWTEVLRGLLALLFGVLYLTLQGLVYALISTLGVYLLCDGALDLYHAVAGKGVPPRHTHVYVGGCVSIIIGLLSLAVPTATLFLSGIFVAIRIIFRGLQVIGEVRRAQGKDSGFRWLYAILLILFGSVLLLPPMLALITRVLVIFVGIYAFGDGLYLLIRGILLGFAPSTFTSLIHRASQRELDIPMTLPATTRRAMVFVRRSGAAGLGHIGWAFEWRNGWFNTGSVENRSFHAVAPPELADFWTAHTVNPLASIQKFGKGYDEYKIFSVVKPHPKNAWRIVVWISHLPYRVFRRNCVDTTYDVLRAYGIIDLPDPATAYAPNDWYDSLAGPSYAIAINPTVPTHILRQSQRPLPTGEIQLKIPPGLSGAAPPWRETGLRGLAELGMSWTKMAHDVRTSFAIIGKLSAGQWQRWQKLHAIRLAKKGIYRRLKQDIVDQSK